MADVLPYIRIKIKDLAREAINVRHEVKAAIDRRRRAINFINSIEAQGQTTEKRGAYETAIMRVEDDSGLIESLHKHTKVHRGSEARSTLLVYGFLRGVSYRTMESSTRSYPDWGHTGDDGQYVKGRMQELLEQYTLTDQQPTILQRFAEWRDSAYAQLRKEFVAQAKTVKVPKLKRRRVIDNLVHDLARMRNLPMRTVLNRAGISPEEWGDIVGGHKTFTTAHAENLSAAFLLPLNLFAALEEEYADQGSRPAAADLSAPASQDNRPAG